MRNAADEGTPARSRRSAQGHPQAERMRRATCSRRSLEWHRRIARWPSGCTRSSRRSHWSSRRGPVAGCPRTPRTARSSWPSSERAEVQDGSTTTLGFSEKANLDEGGMWPTAYALKQLTAAEESGSRCARRNSRPSARTPERRRPARLPLASDRAPVTGRYPGARSRACGAASCAWRPRAQHVVERRAFEELHREPPRGGVRHHRCRKAACLTSSGTRKLLWPKICSLPRIAADGISLVAPAARRAARPPFRRARLDRRRGGSPTPGRSPRWRPRRRASRRARAVYLRRSRPVASAPS